MHSRSGEDALSVSLPQFFPASRGLHCHNLLQLTQAGLFMLSLNSVMQGDYLNRL